MSDVYNFSAGPAVLPKEVLIEAAQEMTNYQGSGLSVMEMSHRSPLYESIIRTAEEDLRLLMDIPDTYDVLFLQGGASLQFSMVPLNLMKEKKADFILTGAWAEKAYNEAKKYGDVKVLASSQDETYSYIPDCLDLEIRPDTDYVHICENNTIYGTKFWTLPDTKGKDLVSDASSCILSEPIDVHRYAVIFAGAQKNIGPAGVTIVIIRKDLVRDDVLPFTPTMLRYKTHADERSMFNTPPAYSIYICGKVFKHVLAQGGLSSMEAYNLEKAAILYSYLDQSEMFHGTVKKMDRSLMNVPFITGNSELDQAFITEAKDYGLIQLKGHRSVGGMRASLYNAMPISGVRQLVAFMKDFEARHK